MFFEFQKKEQLEAYEKMLKAVGSLSKLFNDSSTPYLYYRAHENAFCRAFDAENLSRSDTSIDALSTDRVGIGLKTFLHSNGATKQKVAEFNQLSDEINSLRRAPIELARKVAELRNFRIQTAITQYATKSMIYHCITRDNKRFQVHEWAMNEILIDEIKVEDTERSGNIINFSDPNAEYSFNCSKSTLYKRFSCKNVIHEFEVPILDDPFSLLLHIGLKESLIGDSNTKKPGIDYVYLPLYSTRSKDGEPGEGSGLNQWNAAGRPRDPDEIYIPIPSWIHEKCRSFFPDNNEQTFTIELPNKTELSAKLCQQGSKGLMSNPNKALGKWVLRDVLRVREGQLVTRSILNRAGIDSVYIEKIQDNYYKIDFAKTGKFDNFKVMMT